MLIVLTTTENFDEAEKLARKIIEAKLAACVQVLPQIVSFYVWNDEIQKETECLLLIKTLSAKYDELEKFILAHHTYETPEIAAIPAEKISRKYHEWLNNLINRENGM